MRLTVHKTLELISRLPKYITFLGYRGFVAWVKIQWSKFERPGHTRVKLRKGMGCVYIRNNRTDGGTFETIFIDGDYQLDGFKRADDVKRLYESLLSSGQTPLIVDCGAHIGLSALFFSSLYPESKIVAIEPSNYNLEMTSRNCAQRKNIEIVKGAIWSQPGFLRIKDENSSPTAFQVTPSEEDSEGAFEAYSINGIYEDKGHSFAPFIVKVDIEGAERYLFSDNTEWVMQTPVIFAELHDFVFPNCAISKTFLQAVSSSDRDFLCLGQNVVSIKNNMVLAS